ncbi:hypothetical protein D3870_12960 [Noviherbaspirillum cavernae]|uniref:Uncharacterized protein n=1 Tax=Noviherbaspirillum cavernae TaxID=2320862 RepID=A0A418X2V3_9BURK|nr:hypothetical protein D3870_12960 [Noviherbaspirillum cavernae]
MAGKPRLLRRRKACFANSLLRPCRTGVLSAAAPLQGAHRLACLCRFAGGQQAARIPCSTLLRTASLHCARRS